MTHSRKVARLALLVGFLAPGASLAQDPTPLTNKKPNILLVVDSSGSMEYETATEGYPTCLPAEPDATKHTKSRWIEVLEVLTGSVQNYSCAAMDRTSSAFSDEFKMPGAGPVPPDANYRNPYHRPLSAGCAVTADRSTSLTNAFDWAPPAQTPYPINTSLPLAACGTAFTQAGDGFIDTYNDLARFGLATFDPLPDAGRGYSGGAYAPSYSDGVDGTWSYYDGSPAEGHPADCTAMQVLEVGIRNGAAPATEGKMIYFGHQDLSDTLDRARHDRIQQVLLGTRPYGATPINGALEDVRDFFWSDGNVEPTGVTAAPGSTLYGTAGSGMKLSPRFDEYVECGCRQQHVILITDGEPNLDLRPHCEQAPTIPGQPGVCPFPDDPATILEDMSGRTTASQACSPADAGVNKYQILTHVVGYAATTYAAGTANCDNLRTAVPDWNTAGGTCDTTTDEDLRTCCRLHEFASAGSASGSGKPYMAPDSAALQAALGNIMKKIVKAHASGTQPARSPGTGAADNSMVAFRLLSSYETETGTSGLWRGNLERVRIQCDGSGNPVEQKRESASGDDFPHNVAKNIDDREFVTFVPAPVAGVYSPTGSIRPYFAGAQADGLGAASGGAQLSDVGSDFAASVPAGMLKVDSATDFACTNVGAGTNAVCSASVLKWTTGFADDAGNIRCSAVNDAVNCSVIGDILHSTPTIVNRPSAVVEDETYTDFATAYRGRMMMAYTSSNDGVLHGFAVSPNDAADAKVDSDSNNNEHFAFFPPAVLPQLKNQYRENRAQLLDGVAVTQDVVATANAGGPTAYPYLLERDATSTKAGTNIWRTVLVQAFGGAQPGYFAVDITDARKPSTAGGGPKFLWQLTTTTTGANLFGTGGKPLITTINLGGKEVAVAVLPGGEGGSAIGGSCTRSDPTAGGTWTNTHFNALVTGATFTPRTSVNCYAPADVAARSLTIVRLDSGEVIRTFRRTTTEVAGLTNALFYGTTPVPGNPYLDSPIIGAPAAFPAGVGMVSDRIFVGDQDGALWRVDLSSADPRNWKMKMFFDAYAGKPPGAGKPIIVAPVLSVDDGGKVTVAFATGDQDLSGATGDYQFIYSLTEVENTVGTDFITKVNWFTQLSDGPHVLGPMSLVAGVLYFSTVDATLSNACSLAESSIWGVDYLKPLAAGDLSQGGVPRLQVKDGSVFASRKASDLVKDVNGGSGSAGIVFGVSLEYAPSCKDSTTSTVNTLIGGNRTPVTRPSPADLQLVFQTGSPETSKEGLGFTTGFEVITLEPPRTASSILSWAAILE